MKKRLPRHAVQLAFTALSNGYVKGFLGEGLYKGELKRLCLPGLNCHACPGALGACPIGALQAVISSRSFDVSFYVLGFLLIVGALAGRLVCGFLCPFGLVQDLLHRIPGKKIKRPPYYLDILRYLVLFVPVLLLPAVAVNFIGQGEPWFCKWLCPSGTLMGGIPQLMINPGVLDAAGGIFVLKLGILLFILVLSIFVYRPFCRFLCPLGAIYGLFNRVSLYRYRLDASKCTGCKRCEAACKMNLRPTVQPNDSRCIRCGVCLSVCPEGALKVGSRSFHKPV